MGPRDRDESTLDNPENAEALELVAERLPAYRPADSVKQRVLDSIQSDGRFDRFVAAAADLLDLPVERGKALLDALGDPTVWVPGFLPEMDVVHVRGGPRVQDAITGFVRLKAGFVHPEHEHVGEEKVLILQGSCSDGERIARPGDIIIMAPGSSHRFEVRPGPDLMYLAVVHGGLRMGEAELLPGDPRI